MGNLSSTISDIIKAVPAITNSIDTAIKSLESLIPATNNMIVKNDPPQTAKIEADTLLYLENNFYGLYSYSYAGNDSIPVNWTGTGSVFGSSGCGATTESKSGTVITLMVKNLITVGFDITLANSIVNTLYADLQGASPNINSWVLYPYSIVSKTGHGCDLLVTGCKFNFDGDLYYIFGHSYCYYPSVAPHMNKDIVKHVKRNSVINEKKEEKTDKINVQKKKGKS